MIAPARLAASRILQAVNGGHADLPSALARARTALSDERDRALAAEVATGTLRWQRKLDYLITHFARRPLDRLDPEVLNILRLSAYQLLHLDRVPPAAAVHDAVELTRQAGKRSAAGLVNAVLRAIERNRTTLPLPPNPLKVGRPPTLSSPRAALDFLGVTMSHPEWLVARWLARYGFEAATAWTRFNNSPAPMTLRVNRLKTNAAELSARLADHGVSVRQSRYVPDALLVAQGNPLITPLADSGLFFAQDEASQLVALLATVAPGETVLDACAAPGGKTLGMAAEMENTGLIVATDVRGRRLSLLRRAVARSGATRVRTAQNDLRSGLPFHAHFDCVFVDAPCSGLGTIRREPEIRWRRVEADLARFASDQLLMLSRAAEGVRPGGRLVYTTCSSESEENEEVVEHFLSQHPEFRKLDVRNQLSRSAPAVPAMINDEGHLRTYPHLHGLEAFFGAVMINTHQAGRRELSK